MINIDEVYQLCNYIARKNRKGFTSGTEFSRLANFASRERYAELLGLPSGYQLGRPIPTVAYPQTKNVVERLREFISRPVALNIDSDGRAKLPLDYCLYDDLYKTAFVKGEKRTYPIEIIDGDELSSRLGSYITPPTFYYSIATLEGGYLQFYPSVQSFVRLKYLKYPQEVRWAFTVSATGREVYDATNSVNFEWSAISFNDLVIRILRQIGISLRDAELTQASAQQKQEGV